MYLKKANTSHTVLQYFKYRKIKFGFICLCVLLYTSLVFFAGGVAQKDGVFGKVIKPLIIENIGIPLNYLKSFKAEPENIFIDIKHKNFQKLAYKRDLAIKEGVLLSKPEDIVPAKIRWRDKTVNVKLRLKGDLGDHWEDKSKWSFRIKTKGDKTVLGMKKFSLQHPRTRGFLNDWYLHKLLEKIGGFAILRYKFVSVTVNGKNLGIYLFEEHFEGRLLKNNGFIEAPIIRIRDHLLWYNVNSKYGFRRSHINEHYTLSPIDAFNTSSVNRSPVLLKNFNQAKNLLESFRRGKLSTHQVFNIDKLADLFAVIDLFGYRHSTAYSNIRFYYNPVSSLLEPIGYDNTFIKEANSIEGQSTSLRILEADGPQYIDSDEYLIWYNTFFSDNVFFKKYIASLEKVSKKQFLDELFGETEDDLQEQLNILYKTFPGYRFEGKQVLYRNQEVIKKILKPEQAIYTYFNTFDSDSDLLVLELGNIQSLPVEILGVFYENHVVAVAEKNEILQPKTLFEFVDYKKAKFKMIQGVVWSDVIKNSLVVKYRIHGTENVQEVNVFPWTHLDIAFLERDFMRKQPNFEDFPFISVNYSEKEIFIKPGNWELHDSLIIPKDFKVIAGAGVQLNLKDSALILSYSPLSFIGTADSPIIIKSKDKTGQGIVVIGNNEKSIFENVIFESLSPPSKGDWVLSGALTFYQSDFVMKNCRIDASSLSIIRSKYIFDKSIITQASITGADIKYSNGVFKDSTLNNSGKDGISLTGSVAELHRVSIEKCMDSAIIARESSIIKMYDVKINDCKIKYNVKEQSSIYIDGKEMKSTIQ